MVVGVRIGNRFRRVRRLYEFRRRLVDAKDHQMVATMTDTTKGSLDPVTVEARTEKAWKRIKSDLQLYSAGHNIGKKADGIAWNIAQNSPRATSIFNQNMIGAKSIQLPAMRKRTDA